MKWIFDIEKRYPKSIKLFYEWYIREDIAKFNDSELFNFFWSFDINPFIFVNHNEARLNKPHDIMRLIFILSFEHLEEILNG